MGINDSLSGVTGRTVEGDYGVLDVSQREDKVRPANDHLVRTRLVCLENTHNRGGGRVYPLEKIQAISSWAHDNGLVMHLDGARLWNAIVASGIRAADWAARWQSRRSCYSGHRQYTFGLSPLIASDLRNGVEQLGDMIAAARTIVPFTGAGISTETGIPDFRSPGGLWTKNRPIPFDEFMASQEARNETWRRRFAREGQFGGAKPGRGHRAVASLYRTGKVPGVVTQNIDNLEVAAGITQDFLLQVHGSLATGTCMSCGMVWGRRFRKRLANLDKDELPLCPCPAKREKVQKDVFVSRGKKGIARPLPKPKKRPRYECSESSEEEEVSVSY